MQERRGGSGFAGAGAGSVALPVMVTLLVQAAAGCGAGPRRAPVPGTPGAHAATALPTPAPATVEGYVTALADVMDQTADEVCACGERQCSESVLGQVDLRAGAAAIGYRLGKQDTPELTAFLELMSGEDFQFAAYLEQQRPRWYEQFEARLQICLARIAAASAPDGDEGDDGTDETDGADGDGAAGDAEADGGVVKASYQPAAKAR